MSPAVVTCFPGPSQPFLAPRLALVRAGQTGSVVAGLGLRGRRLHPSSWSPGWFWHAGLMLGSGGRWRLLFPLVSGLKISLPSLAVSRVHSTAGIPRRSRRRKSIAIAYESAQGDGAEQGTSEPQRPRWEPRDWRQQLERIQEMRRNRDAPVDEMGVEKCYDSSAPPQVTTPCCPAPSGGHMKIQPCFCSPPAFLILTLPLDKSHFGYLQNRKINARCIRTLGWDWSHKRLLHKHAYERNRSSC